MLLKPVAFVCLIGPGRLAMLINLGKRLQRAILHLTNLCTTQRSSIYEYTLIIIYYYIRICVARVVAIRWLAWAAYKV